MFSLLQKREISEAIQKILRDTNHPELPKSREISFQIHVSGLNWSYADICNNAAVTNPTVNPHNEAQDTRS